MKHGASGHPSSGHGPAGQVPGGQAPTGNDPPRRLRSAGSRRQAGRRAMPAPSGRLAYGLVLAGVVAALVIIRQGVHLVQSGTLVLAAVLLVAAVARLVLPDGRAGLLSSRRRLLDVVIFAVLGIGLLVAGLVLPAPG
jgi:hypothetical protein